MREEIFGIASFRSRQQVMQLESALRRMGVPASIVTTPRDVSLGCGLSVRFELSDASAVRDVYQHAPCGAEPNTAADCNPASVGCAVLGTYGGYKTLLKKWRGHALRPDQADRYHS